MPSEAVTRRDGFTSFEATVALAISAGVIAVALTAFSTWADRVADTERRLLAIKTAEALIARIGLDLRPVPQQHRGTQSAFVWEFEVGFAGSSQPLGQGLLARFSARQPEAAAPFVRLEVPVAPAIAR
jgi:type II secretory pathway pseudopilin PulG